MSPDAHQMEYPLWMRHALKNAKDFSLDIGGSLTKCAFISKSRFHEDASLFEEGEKFRRVISDNVSYSELDIHFVKFQTSFLDDCLCFIKNNVLKDNDNYKNLVVSQERQCSLSINVTGGGAYKFQDRICQELRLRPEKQDEMQCIIKGCIFLLTHIKCAAFEFIRDDALSCQYRYQNFSGVSENFAVSGGGSLFPFLLVNVGSGVSIVKVESPDKYERVGGTSIGGGTFWGLGRAITGVENFEQLLNLALEGNYRTVDTLVSDIYGGAYEKLNLPGDLIASTFCKLGSSSFESVNDSNNVNCNLKQMPRSVASADFLRSLLYLISNEIGQIASLYGQLHNIRNIYFGGFFIRNNPVTMHTITYAVNFFSKKTQTAMFLRHDGYLGVIGALSMRNWSVLFDSHSWDENYCLDNALNISHSNRFPFSSYQESLTLSINSYKGEFIRWNVNNLLCGDCVCVAAAESAAADQMICLSKDDSEKWINYCLDNIKILFRYFSEQKSCEPLDLKGLEEQLRLLSEKNLLTPQIIFDLKDQFIQRYFNGKKRFFSIYKKGQLNHFKNGRPTQTTLQSLKNIIVGNVFDLGCNSYLSHCIGRSNNDSNFYDAPFTEVYSMLEQTLSTSKNTLKLNNIQTILTNNTTTNKIVMFLDNGGYELFYGIFPLVHTLIKNHGKNITLVSNSFPTINDVTFKELIECTNYYYDVVLNDSDSLEHFINTKQLTLRETGLGSVCMNLTGLLNKDLVNELQSLQQDDTILLIGPYRSFFKNRNIKRLKNINVIKIGAKTISDKKVSAEFLPKVFIKINK